MATTRTTPRRLLTMAAACVAVSLVATACGGSDVTDTAQAPAGSAVDTTTAGVTPNVPAGDVPAADAPAAEAAGAPDADAAAANASAADASAADAPTADAPAAADVPGAPDQPATNNKKDERAAQRSAQQQAVETGPAAAVQKLVASHPIFGGDDACKPATGTPVNIGNVSTLSGVLGETLGPVRPALETFVASQNACGGLNGHPIKFFLDDDQGDPSTAVTKVQNMIQNNKILAFVGNIQVLTVDAVVPTIKQAGIPIIGADLTNNTWFQNPLMFPQGAPPQAVSWGYVDGALNHFKKKTIGSIYCIEVPRACEQINRALEELAPTMGATVKKSLQASITAPSYVQQCLDLKNSGVEVLALTIDAASQTRIARSCEQVGYFPDVLPYPLGVGNEEQFLGSKWLGDSYIPMNHFPWFANNTAAEKYWQSSIKKFNPGFASGGAASLGWTAGALLVAASSNLPAQNPTTQDLLDSLYTFKGQKFTELGGLTGPLVFNEGANPQIPYCVFAGISNADNSGWAKAISKPKCTDIIAPSDPQAAAKR